MCDVCKAMNIDTVVLNGPDNVEETAKLYRVYKDGPAKITICRFHSIQLFILGEKHFLLQNRAFMRALGEHKGKFSIAA